MRAGRLEVTNGLTIAVRWDRIDAAFRNGPSPILHCSTSWPFLNEVKREQKT
jgi:hypothetical protein